LDGAARLTHADLDVVRLDGGHGLGPGLPTIPESPVGPTLLPALHDGELVGGGPEAGRLAGVACAADAVINDLGRRDGAAEPCRRLSLELLLARGDHRRPAGPPEENSDDEEVFHALPPFSATSRAIAASPAGIPGVAASGFRGAFGSSMSSTLRQR